MNNDRNQAVAPYSGSLYAPLFHSLMGRIARFQGDARGLQIQAGMPPALRPDMNPLYRFGFTGSNQDYSVPQAPRTALVPSEF